MGVAQTKKISGFQNGEIINYKGMLLKTTDKTVIIHDGITNLVEDDNYLTYEKKYQSDELENKLKKCEGSFPKTTEYYCHKGKPLFFKICDNLYGMENRVIHMVKYVNYQSSFDFDEGAIVVVTRLLDLQLINNNYYHRYDRLIFRKKNNNMYMVNKRKFFRSIDYFMAQEA